MVKDDEFEKELYSILSHVISVFMFKLQIHASDNGR